MEWLYNLFGGLFSSIFNIGSTILTNKANERLAASANQANERLVDKANSSAMAQANLEYARNNASGQIQQLQNAGLSRFGALNMLNGAGAYNAAPITNAQNEAAQLQAPQIGDIGSLLQRSQMSVPQLQLIQNEVKSRQQQYEFAKAEEQRKQDEHNERILSARLERTRSEYDYNSTIVADDMFKLLQPYLSELDGDVKNINKLVYEHEELKNSEAWKKMTSKSYEVLQGMLSSNQQTSAATAQNKIIWNDADRIAFRNSVEALDKARKMLENKKLRFEVSKQPEMYELQKLIMGEQFSELQQRIAHNYAKENRELTAMDLENEAKALGIDIQKAIHSVDLQLQNIRINGNAVEREAVDLLDTIEAFIMPFKGLIGGK